MPSNAFAFGQYGKQTALAACSGCWTIADRAVVIPELDT